MSLKILSEYTKINSSKLKKIEEGVIDPNDEDVMNLTSFFDVDKSFFSKPINVFPEEYCHFRSRKTTPESYKKQAHMTGVMFNRIVNYFDEILDLPKINFPKKEVSSNEDIERAAERCRIDWGLGIRAPILNMFRAAENAGAIITSFSNLSEKIDAFVLGNNRPTIVYNPTKSVCRSRFDIAHECGHIVMHEDVVTGEAKTEAEANRFASAFLLPRCATINEFSFLKRSSRIDWYGIGELKLRWRVSKAAIVRRAYELDIIDSNKYVGANIYLRKTDQYKTENDDIKISHEEPEIITNILNFFKNNKQEGLLLISNHLRVNLSFLKDILEDAKIDTKDIDFKRKAVRKIEEFIPRKAL